jgi:hypothetical protein|tara:strand:+ start:2277 stop:2882 length:606 start_codon:yes stop_codon:yes gene_type:complete
MIKIAVCVPARDSVHAGFALSLAKIASSLTKSNIEHTILINLGSVIPQQRNTLAEQALEWGATHILWLDSDMHLPARTAEILLEHNKDIVAAAYSTRVPPYNITAFCDPDDMTNRLKESSGLHKVWAVGMGCMLVNTNVYSVLGKPWHQYVYNQDTKDLSGEDIYFCKTANDAGFEVYVDAYLSYDIAHYGTKSFTLGDIK